MPKRRLRLFNSLKALGTPAAPTVTTRLWGQVTIDTELCRSCRMCTVFCPTGALTLLTEEDFKARQMEEQKKKAAEMMKKQLER